MELVLFRTYHARGTNGELYACNSLQCYTIELPWLDNKPSVSCIPEGRYELKKRYSPKFKDHLLVKDVPGRSLVLIHPANDALKELKGCIAPVSYLSDVGIGNESKKALAKLLKMVYEGMEKEPVFLIIKNKNDDYSTKGESTHSQIF